jgi:hypothetical protein
MLDLFRAQAMVILDPNHIELDPVRDMVEATRKAMEGMIVAPTHVVISERVALLLFGNGARLSDRVTVLMPDGSDVNGLDFAGTRREPIVHIDTPKPLGKRAKRRSKGKAK